MAPERFPSLILKTCVYDKKALLRLCCIIGHSWPWDRKVSPGRSDLITWALKSRALSQLTEGGTREIWSVERTQCALAVQSEKGPCEVYGSLCKPWVASKATRTWAPQPATWVSWEAGSSPESDEWADMGIPTTPSRGPSRVMLDFSRTAQGAQWLVPATKAWGHLFWYQ